MMRLEWHPTSTKKSDSTAQMRLHTSLRTQQGSGHAHSEETSYPRTTVWNGEEAYCAEIKSWPDDGKPVYDDDHATHLQQRDSESAQ